MPSHKRQHFVPQLLLRNFSHHHSRSCISVYNLERDLFVQHASLRDQAQRRFFYGRDLVVEEALARQETGAALALQTLLRHKDCRSIALGHRADLLTFLALLHARTQSTAENINRTVDYVAKSILAHTPAATASRSVTIALKNAPQIALQHAMFWRPLWFDLRCALLVTDGPLLVISDTPVILHNALYEVCMPHVMGTGLACRGLTIFVPLAKDTCLLLYDSAVYDVRTDGTSRIPIRSGTARSLN